VKKLFLVLLLTSAANCQAGGVLDVLKEAVVGSMIQPNYAYQQVPPGYFVDQRGYLQRMPQGYYQQQNYYPQQQNYYPQQQSYYQQ